MSRLGKKPITIPNGVTFTVNADTYVAKGPKGELTKPKVSEVNVEVKNQAVELSVIDPAVNVQKVNWGLAASLIMNMLQGVSEGFTRRLEINGVGYKAEMKGKNLVLNVGYSHPVTKPAVANVDIAVEKNVIIVSGVDKEVVGQVAADIRKVRQPEPYKGKGIKYEEEIIRRKVGKQIKGSSA